MSYIVYLNGQYLPIEDAKISVLDRGFTFGDGVYEVIPVYEGHIFTEVIFSFAPYSFCVS